MGRFVPGLAKHWREFQEQGVTVDSLWVSYGTGFPRNAQVFRIPYRKELEDLKSKVGWQKFHGGWIPEIPYQMVLRFTKEGDWVWSVFAGTGIDYEVAEYLGRNCVVTDLVSLHPKVEVCDARNVSLGRKFKLVLAHPPYWDAIKFTDKEEDGCNKGTLRDFLLWWRDVVRNIWRHLEDDGVFVFACSDLYKCGEELTLGFWMKDIAVLNGFRLKQVIVKDFGEHGSPQSYNLWYYRHLKNGTGFFFGDSIFVLRKGVSKFGKEYLEVIQEVCNE